MNLTRLQDARLNISELVVLHIKKKSQKLRPKGHLQQYQNMRHSEINLKKRSMHWKL